MSQEKQAAKLSARWLLAGPEIVRITRLEILWRSSWQQADRLKQRRDALLLEAWPQDQDQIQARAQKIGRISSRISQLEDLGQKIYRIKSGEIKALLESHGIKYPNP